MRFYEGMGFQFLGPGITVLSPSDPRPPTVRIDSIVVLAGGRRRCIGLGGVGFAPSNEDWARLPLDEPVSADHVQAKAGPGPIFGTFFGH